MIWIARHGNREDFVNPDWKLTAERKYDPSLSSDGIQQAKLLGDRLEGEGIRYIISSPYLRAVETAAYVAKELNVPVYIEDGLGEHLCREWFESKPEVMELTELSEKFPCVRRDYISGVIPKYPESREEFYKRMEKTAEILVGRFKNDFLAVGHGASVTGFVNSIMGRDIPVKCALCSLSKLEVNKKGEWELKLNGDTSHLEAVEDVTRFI